MLCLAPNAEVSTGCTSGSHTIYIARWVIRDRFRATLAHGGLNAYCVGYRSSWLLAPARLVRGHSLLSPHPPCAQVAFGRVFRRTMRRLCSTFHLCLVCVETRASGSLDGCSTSGSVLLCAVSTWKTACLLYTSPSPRDATLSRMPSSA